ncbi:hypothetical protein GCM10027266_20400 [Arenimonas alkanexedens]
MLGADLSQRIEHGGNQPARLLVALRFEQPRAAADIGKKDGLGPGRSHDPSLGDAAVAVIHDQIKRLQANSAAIATMSASLGMTSKAAPASGV